MFFLVRIRETLVACLGPQCLRILIEEKSFSVDRSSDVLLPEERPYIPPKLRYEVLENYHVAFCMLITDTSSRKLVLDIISL